MISSEEIYDEEVSPIVDQLVKLCGRLEPPIPILTCSSFMSTEQGVEGSCCSASLKGNESLRMREIAQIMMNKGKAPMSTMAKMMLGKPTVEELDANWYESSETTFQHYLGQVCLDLMRIRDLVDDTHRFPTAIIVQTPKKGVYLTIGKWPSQVYEGIQMARVIASMGYTEDASTTLLGGDALLGRRLHSITRGLRPGERVVIPPDAAPKEIRKEAKIIIPLLRGGTPPPPPTREEIRNTKWNSKVKKERVDETKRKRAVEKKQKQEHKKKRKTRKAKKKKEGRWRTTNILNLM